MNLLQKPSGTLKVLNRLNTVQSITDNSRAAAVDTLHSRLIAVAHC
jgi:hypothetical protein